MLAAVAAPLGCSGSVASGPAGAESSGRPTAPPRSKSRARATPTWPARAARAGRPAPAATASARSPEAPPPDEQHKRFEIRLAGIGGHATLDSPTLGHFAADGEEVCFTIDVLPGTTSDVVFTATEAQKEGGIAPLLDIAEYGPKGP